MVDPSSPDAPFVAAYCSPESNGQLYGLPTEDTNYWRVPDVAMQPGDDAARTGIYQPIADEVGSVTCAAVILEQAQGWRWLGVAARITTIPPIVVTILPAATTTTTPTTGP